MQHAHVKRKEHTMNRYMLEEFHNDPALYRRLAEREQARAIRAAFAALPGGLARLFGYLKARFAAHRRLRPAHWAARLG
jgi:hypothetical protein